MEKYTIYCTPEQIRKALELGAPIHRIPIGGRDGSKPSYFTKQPDEDGWAECPAYYIPTAEQMIGWLEDKCISVKSMCFSWCHKNKPTWQVYTYNESTGFWDEISYGHSNSMKEATLAAIDAALDYLIKIK